MWRWRQIRDCRWWQKQVAIFSSRVSQWRQPSRAPFNFCLIPLSLSYLSLTLSQKEVMLLGFFFFCFTASALKSRAHPPNHPLFFISLLFSQFNLWVVMILYGRNFIYLINVYASSMFPSSDIAKASSNGTKI